MPRPPALVLTPVARDRAIEKLQEHYAQNHLEVQDFERRVEKAENARTTAELDDALAGLPTLPGEALVPAERAGQVTHSLRAVLASTTRSGQWRVPSRVVVSALLGNVELDLMEAEIHGDVDVEVRATLGNVRIIVPEGLAIDVDGRARLGSFDHVERAPASARDARRVRIFGRATLGSVAIEVRKKPGLLSAVRGFFSS